MEQNIELKNKYDDELISKVTSLYNNYDSASKRYKQKINDYRDLYFGIRRNRRVKSLANVFVPEFFKSIETIVSNIYQIIMATDPFFITIGREASDEQKSKDIQALMEYFVQEMKLTNNFDSYMRSYCLDGIIFVQIFWEFIEKIVKRPNEQGQLTDINDIIKDSPMIEYVNTKDIFIDPTFSSMEEAEFIIRRSKMTYAQLMKLKKQNIIDVMPEEIAEGKMTKQNDTVDYYKTLKTLGFDVDTLKKKEYEVLQGWGLCKRKYIEDLEEEDESGEEEIESRIILCNGKILRKSPNPYWHQSKPFVCCSMFKLDDTQFSLALGDVADKPQEQLNDMHNQQLDNNTFALFNMWLKDRNANIDSKQLEAKPNAIVETDNINGLIPLRANVNTFIQAGQLEAQVREDIKQVTGALSLIQGVPSSKRKTAKEVQVLFGEGSVRVRGYAFNISENFIKPILQMTYQLVQQYMTVPRVVRIIGEQGATYKTFTPEDVRGNFDFIPKLMTDSYNKFAMQENLMTAIGVLSKIPNFPVESLFRLLRKWYDSMDFKDGNEIFPMLAQNANMPMQGQPTDNEPLPPQLQMEAEKILEKAGI